MRRLVLIAAAIALLGGVPPASHAAQSPGRRDAVTVTPTGSPSPGARANDRARAPGFVVLLVLLGLGLLWQIQRSRRATAEISARSLEDLELGLRPPDDERPP